MRDIHPVTLEIVRNCLIAALDEIETNLCRTAYSPIVYEVRDLTCAWVDRDGRLIAQGRKGLPIFLADIAPPVIDTIEVIGPDNWQPGDIAVTNYPKANGHHLNNVVCVSPVFHAGEIVAYTAIRTHWIDVGGKVAGSNPTDSTDIFQEGLQMRALKLYKLGELCPEIARVVACNTRYPDLLFGDIRAQAAACRLGERRFVELLDKYGAATVRACIDEIWDRSEQAARRAVRAIPNGVYRAESFLDDDGIGDEPIPVRITVEVADEEITVDFSDMAPTLRGPFNSGPSGGTAVAKVAFKYLTLPDYPADEGAFRPLRIVLPPGTMVSAEPPAPMGLWNVPLPTVIDTILKAFSEPLKDRIPAGHLADICSFFWSNLPGRARWVNLEGCPGGWGARPFEDGPSPMKSVSHGDTYKGSLEVEESLSPYQLRYYRLATDSGGAGRFRGGLGIDIAWQFPEGCLAMIELERSKCPPWGLHGGKPGRGNTGEILRPDGTSRGVQKVTGAEFAPGTTIVYHTAGGGGWGDPLKRDPAAVLNDVLQGYVSLERARDDYGVVLGPDRRAVDAVATAVLRERLRQAGGGRDSSGEAETWRA
jgi:N-methylhydantoinase B